MFFHRLRGLFTTNTQFFDLMFSNIINSKDLSNNQKIGLQISKKQMHLPFFNFSSFEKREGAFRLNSL